MENEKTEKPRHDGRATYYKFKNNNIWGKVQEEELLKEVTCSMDGIGVKEKNSIYVDRGPESYEVDRDVLKEYMKKPRPWQRKRREIEEGEIESSEDEFELHSDSSISSSGLCADDMRRIRSRKPPPKRSKSKNVKRAKISGKGISQNETEDDSQFVRRIALGLQEENYGLIGQITELLGHQKVEKIYRKILKIEQLGGIMTKDVTRRRSPGGAFFYLLQSHPSTASPALKSVFDAYNKKAKPRSSKGIAGSGTGLRLKTK